MKRVKAALRICGWVVLIVLVLPAIVLRVADEFSWAGLPALPAPPTETFSDRGASVRLHLHVHTDLSHDAVGTRDEIARAARRSGVDGVWIADHLPRVPDRSTFARPEDDPWAGGSRLPDDYAPPGPPEWNDGVLLVEGREFTVASDVGRVLLFGADSTFARWDGGLEPLLDLIRRRPRSFAMVTHGRGARERDFWHAGKLEEIHGWEALTLSDSGRRRLEELRAIWRLPTAVVSLVTGRFHHALAGTLTEGPRDPGVLAFDSLAAEGSLALIGTGNAHPKTRILGRLVPSYSASFRAISTHVALDGPLPSDPARARDAVHEALREGRSWISILDGQGARDFRFQVEGEGGSEEMGVTEEMGGVVTWAPGLTLHAGFTGSNSDRRIFRVVKDGVPILEGRGGGVSLTVEAPGVYRIEVDRFGARVGNLFVGRRFWIASSAIRVGAAEDETGEGR